MRTTPSPRECFSVVLMYVQPVFILVNVSTKQITTSKNTPPQRNEVVSGDGNCCYPRALALLNDEIGHEKQEDIPRSSDSLLEKNPKVFVLLLFSSNSLGKKGNITENPAETVGKYIEIRTSVLQQPICTYASMQKKGFSFAPIINAVSFLLTTKRKQSRC